MQLSYLGLVPGSAARWTSLGSPALLSCSLRKQARAALALARHHNMGRGRTSQVITEHPWNLGGRQGWGEVQAQASNVSDGFVEVVSEGDIGQLEKWDKAAVRTLFW